MSEQAKDFYDYLIIGADAAGNSAAGQIRRRDKDASIGILEKGEIISYGACGLPYAISGHIDEFEKLIHFTPEAFGSRTKADVLIRHEVTAIDTGNKKVTVKTDDGDIEIGYNRLMIGTGASPIRLPFIDYNHNAVFELKSVPDGKAIRSFIEKTGAKTAGIIGAGYIGLEAAEAFRERGLEVTVIEALDRAMPRLPESFSTSIAKQMKAHDIQFLPDTRAESMTTAGNSIVLKTSTGDHSFDLLLVSVGIKPNTAFAENTDIKLEKGAIVIDQYGRTTAENVFSGGDCAMVHHQLLEENVYYPLGHTANKQGRIAGMNMASPENEMQKFNGVLGTQIFKFFDTAYGATGLSKEQAQAAGYTPVEVSAMRPSKAGYFPGSGKVKMSLIFDENTQQILGAYYAGPHDSWGMIDAAAALIYKKATAEEIAWMDFAYAPPYAPVWNSLISAAGKLASDD